MQNLNNSLFKKFESNKINNLAKVIGGLKLGTTYNNGNSCDYWSDEVRCGSANVGVQNTQTGEVLWGDIYAAACD